MESNRKSIDNVFHRRRIYKVPYFQRSYVWGEEEWERFFEDIIFISKENMPYFMGALIFKGVSRSINEENIDLRIVIDGQQRLTTIVLFFKAFFGEKYEEFKTTFFTYGDTYSGKNIPPQSILINNHLDKAIFEKIVYDQEHLITDEEKESKIYLCYDFFRKKLGEIENNINPNLIYSNMQFVCIDVLPDEDEQQIFDTINSLGVSLTTAELLKNYFFNEDEKSYEENWKSIFEKDKETRDYWEKVITRGRTKRTNLDVFLESFLIIKVQQNENVTTLDKNRYFKVNSLFNSYKDYLNRYEKEKQKDFIKELKEYSSIYIKTIQPDILEETFGKEEYLSRLNLIIFGLEITTIIPYLLFLFKNSDSDNQINISNYIEKYLIRRILAKETTKNYNNLFRESLIKKDFLTFSNLKSYIEEKSDSVNNMPDDNKIKNAFYYSDIINKQALGVLYLLELSLREEANSTMLRSLNKYSLEHIMPKKWENNWKMDTDLNEDELKEFKKKRNEIIRTLGNLTLINDKLNKSLSESNWEVKLEGKGKKYKGLKENASGILTIQKYLSEEHWNEETIRKRADELYDLVINKVWKI